MFLKSIPCKIFSEKSRNHTKLDNNEKIWWLFLNIFFVPVPQIYFCRGNWTLDCIPRLFWDFTNISLFPRNHKSFGSSSGSSYIRFLILDIEFSFTWGEWNVYSNFEKFQVIGSTKDRSIIPFVWRLAYIIDGWWYSLVSVLQFDSMLDHKKILETAHLYRIAEYQKNFQFKSFLSKLILRLLLITE